MDSESEGGCLGDSAKASCLACKVVGLLIGMI